MKRTSFRQRLMAFPTPLVRSGTNRQSDFPGDFSGSRQTGFRARKIFIIKQTNRLESTNGARRKMRRIIIFDNHPESLRLVFGLDANPLVDLVQPARTRLWEFVVGGTLVNSSGGRNVLAAAL